MVVPIQDQKLTDPIVVHSFTNGTIISTFYNYLQELSLQNGPSSALLQSQNIDADSDERPSEKKKRYGRFNTAITETKRHLAAVHTQTASLYTIKVQDPLSSLHVPDDLDELDLFHVAMYKSGVRAVTSKPTRFTDDMKCAFAMINTSLTSIQSLQILIFFEQILFNSVSCTTKLESY